MKRKPHKDCCGTCRHYERHTARAGFCKFHRILVTNTARLRLEERKPSVNPWHWCDKYRMK